MQEPDYFSGYARCNNKDWLLLIVDIQFVVIDCMQNTECLYQNVRAISNVYNLLLRMISVLCDCMQEPDYFRGCAHCYVQFELLLIVDV